MKEMIIISMSKDRVLFVVSNNLDLGGIQNVIMNIVRNLSTEFIFDVVCFKDQVGYFDDEFTSYGGKIFRLNRGKKKNSIAARFDYYLRGHRIVSALESIIAQHGPYIAIHSNIGTEDGLILKAGKKMTVPVRISHAHTAFDRKYNLIAKAYTKYLNHLILKNATSLIACSKKAGEKLYGTHHFSVIYNTVDRKFFDNTIPQTIHKAPHLLQVGLICENKNQMFSLSVLKALKVKYPESQLVFIGAPKDSAMVSYFNIIKEKTKEEGMNESVHFLPADSDVKAEMQKADYIILPSRFEGLPVTNVEAQMLGIKCFVSTGVTEEVDCGGNIYLRLNDGAELWANRIALQFEEDHGARKKYDMSRFMPDVIMEQYRKLYRGELD